MVLTVAHRGSSAYAPENTLPAMQLAVDSGCDLVEVDVQRTRDGALVLVHDTDLERTTGRRAAVADVTLEELRRLDAGSWFSQVYAGARVPTLDELLDLLDGQPTGLLLEIKRPDLSPGIAVDVARLLRARRTPLEDVVVQSFDHHVMRQFSRYAPEFTVGLLGHPPVRRLREVARWASYVNPHHRRATSGYVAAVQAAGMRSMVWTVDRDADLHRALALGVDGVISNRPDALLRIVEERLVPA